MKDNAKLLNFIELHKDEDGLKLLLKYGKSFDGISVEDAVIQINGRKRSRHKIPSFIANGLLFPDSLSSEQATDERVARYHANLIGPGHTVLDMTAGLGIDAMSIARVGNQVTALELDPRKAEFLDRNAAECGVKDFRVINADSREYITTIIEGRASSLPQIVCIDPARRDVADKRVYALRDCQPDITMFYKTLLDKGITVMIKVSPLLDLTALERELTGISEFHVVSVKGECKEILIIMRPESEISKQEAKVVYAVDLDEAGNPNFIFCCKRNRDNGNSTEVIEDNFDYDGKWLYEPGSSVMKLIDHIDFSKSFPGIKKVNRNTQLYVSNSLYPDFPGRKMKVERQLVKKDLAGIKGLPRNVAVRNYPVGAEELRKKLKTREGKDFFIYGFRSGAGNKPILVECRRD